MTEHLEVRIPIQDVKLAVTCLGCKTEVVIDPAVVSNARFAGMHPTLECGVCSCPFDSRIVTALYHLIEARQGVGNRVLALAAQRH
jgi:hypothetical protein